MAKYKLVYEKTGSIKGSKVGVPAADDPELITRDVLEGKEEPTPASVIEKGSVIKLGNDSYRVLSVNDDLTDCEVVHVGPATFSKFRDKSPSSDPIAGTTFLVDGVEKTGLKYEGSLLDQACEAFYNELSEDIQAAIIEQEVTQDMYNTQAAEGEEDFAIDNSSTGGMVYRFKKVSNAPVAVGSRHAYALSCGAIKNYYGGTSVDGVTIAKDFQLQSWFSDAISNTADRACCLSYVGSSGVYVGNGSFANMYCVCPAFHIDLTKINL